MKHTSKKFFTLLLVAIALVLAAHTPARAELSPEQQSKAKEIFFEVLSPFCPGRALNDCPSGSSIELKNEIRSMIQAGKTRDEIVSVLLTRYGEGIRAVPSTKGFQSLAWSAPIGFLLLGGLLITVWLRKKAIQEEKPAASATPQAPLDPELQKRIERELYR